MSNTQNTYTGDGVTTEYSITFEYINTEDIKVSIDEQETTAFSFIDPVTIELDSPAPIGQSIRIFRRTNVDELAHEFFPGSSIRAEDLNQDFEQVLFVSQESQRDSELSYSALPIAAEARATANTAEATANQALTDSAAATATANTADTNATQAINTSNTADAKADGAIEIATAAANSVSDVVNYTLVGTVAGIPTSPGVDDRIEIIDSTGIESFSPLSGLPDGFVGDDGKSVRLNRDTGNTTWQFVSYIIIDPDSRYAQRSGTVFTGTVSANEFIGDLTGNSDTATDAESVKVTTTGFGSSSKRPIACFGSGSTPQGGSYTTIRYPQTNAPIIKGDGEISAPGGFVGDLTGNADTATQAGNASTLENLNSSQFIRSDASDTVTGRIEFANITDFTQVGNAAKFQDNCKLGLGSSNDAQLFVDGSHAYLDLGTGIGNFYIRDGTTTRFTFNDNGDFTATGNLNGALGNSQVRTAIAQGNVGNVGTYAMLRKTSAGNANPGDVINGFNLQYANSDSSSGESPSGNWRCMGFADASTPESATTLWLRIE